LDNHAHFLFGRLNPLRARLVSDLAQLADYPYCGHAAVLRRWPVCWQDAEYVLRQFGENLKAARRKYQEYVTRDAALGRQPELLSGSVSREASGWKKAGSAQGFGATDARQPHPRRTRMRPFGAGRGEAIVGPGLFAAQPGMGF
jgi:hypothetical protein